MCIFSAILAFFFLPQVTQDSVTLEDARYREHLEAHGWDTSRMGVTGGVGEVDERSEVRAIERGEKEKGHDEL